MNNVIISTHGLKKYYFVGESTVKALDGVDMTVNKGESVCIAGRSGSGKSTMLNMLAGLELPTAGTVQIAGRRIERMNEKARIRFRRDDIGFVFQSYNLMPQYTALENVALPLAIRGTSEETMELLTGLFRERGTTFILVSHDPGMRKYTDRTITFSDGRISNTIAEE